jgi:hypothetical protein
MSLAEEEALEVFNTLQLASSSEKVWICLIGSLILLVVDCEGLFPAAKIVEKFDGNCHSKGAWVAGSISGTSAGVTGG